MTTYTPNPIDTSDVQLNPSLHQLMEELAENTHDVWAQQRISEGWIYGNKRDNAQKNHPDLLPYEELTDGETVSIRRVRELRFQIRNETM